MSSIVLLYPRIDSTTPITRLSRECERLRFLMDTATDVEAQRTHHADLEANMLLLSRLTPETPQDARAYSQTTICQLECMIAAWDGHPTPAEALLLTMLEQLQDYLNKSLSPPVTHAPA